MGKLITDLMSLSVYFFKVWVGGLWAASLSGKSRLHRRRNLCCFCSCNFCRKPQRKDFFFMQTGEKALPEPGKFQFAIRVFEGEMEVETFRSPAMHPPDCLAGGALTDEEDGVSQAWSEGRPGNLSGGGVLKYVLKAVVVPVLASGFKKRHKVKSHLMHIGVAEKCRLHGKSI